MPILTPQERIGTCIGGRYRIERVLARGGMSVLFEGRDERTHRAVAVKLLKTEDCVDDRRVARFLQEMRLTAELRHPHVVDVLDLGQDAGVPYLVMELLHGRTLQAELDARGQLDVAEALAVLLPMIAALSAVHTAGVVHRDVKPDNIFLHFDDAGRMVPKLLDFGIAKPALSTFNTRTGAVLGTPDYMAPEQVLGDDVGPATDVWAMGVVVYRTLCGETPFRSSTMAQTLAKLAHERAPLLRAPGLPAALGAALDRALVREVAGRYRGMDEFASAIVTCAREAGIAVSEHGQSRQLASAMELAHGAPPSRRTEPSRGEHPLPTRQRAIVRNALVAFAVLAVAAVGVAGSRQSIANANRDLRGASVQTLATPTRSLASGGAREQDATFTDQSAASAPQSSNAATAELVVLQAARDATRTSAADSAVTAETPQPGAQAPVAQRPRIASRGTKAAKLLRLRDLPVAVKW